MRHLPKLLILSGLFLMPLVWPDQKEDFAILLISAFLICLQTQEKTKIDANRWLMALLLYLPISVICAPDINIKIGAANLGGVWMWKSLVWCFGYYCVYAVVTRVCLLREKDRNRIAFSIVISAILSAVYAYLQIVNLDQWQYTRPYSQIGSPDMARVTAMIGNPTYLAVYLCACLPFVFRYAGWPWGLFCLVAMLICHSFTSVFGGMIALSVYLAIRFKNNYSLAILPILAIGLLFISILSIQKFDNGRIAVWSNAIQDWQSPPLLAKNGASKTHAITGRGLGSFAVMYPLKHPNPNPAYEKPIWDTVHNEYLETLYSIGIIGLVLVLGSIWHILFDANSAVLDKFYGSVYLSFMFLLVSASTLPIWHVEPMRFMVVIFAGILSGRYLRLNPTEHPQE